MTGGRCPRSLNRAVHLELLGYLSPEERGSLTAMRDLIAAVHGDAPAASPVPGLALSAEMWRSTRAQAACVFQDIGGLVTAWPWVAGGDPVDQFMRWREVAR